MKRALWLVVIMLGVLVGYAFFRASSGDPLAPLYGLKPSRVEDGPNANRAPDKKIRTFHFEGKAAYASLEEFKKSLLGRKGWYLRQSDTNYAFFSDTKLAGQGDEVDWYLTDDISGKAIVHTAFDARHKLQVGRFYVSAGPKSGLPPMKISPKATYDAQLGMAAQNDDVSSAEDAIKHGAVINPPAKNGFCPLYWALTGKGMRVAEVLVKHGANVNIPTEFDDSLVGQMATEGHADAVRFLVKHGAKIDKNGDLLRVAKVTSPVDSILDWPGESFFDDGWLEDYSWKNSAESAQALIDAGANVNAIDGDGDTPISQAARNGNARLVKVLLDNGAQLPRSPDKLAALVKKRHRNAWRQVLQLIESQPKGR